MALISDETWLAAINMVGGEDFDTGYPAFLRGVFIEEFEAVTLGEFQVESMTKAIEIRTSDIAVHQLVKQSTIRRVADDQQYSIRRLQRGDGGMTFVVLGR